MTTPLQIVMTPIRNEAWGGFSPDGDEQLSEFHYHFRPDVDG